MTQASNVKVRHDAKEVDWNILRWIWDITSPAQMTPRGGYRQLWFDTDDEILQPIACTILKNVQCHDARPAARCKWQIEIFRCKHKRSNHIETSSFSPVADSTLAVVRCPCPA